MIALVTGLSESKYYSPDYDLTVGVNNCPFPVNHLLVADHPNVFDSKRLQTIIKHPAELFTHIPNWNQLRQTTKIELASGRSTLTELKYKERYCHSITSAFMAVVHAFYQGSTEIHIAGIDIVGHPNLGHPDKIKIIRKDFTNLNNELNKLGCKLYLIRSNPDGALIDIIERK